MRSTPPRFSLIGAMRNARTRTAIAAAVLGAAAALGAATADQRRPWPPAVGPLPPESPVLAPAEALQTFALPPGYRIELVASEPLIQDPILMEWDPAGRLWAIETPSYMRDIRGSGELDPTGRIVVLEDTDRDGRMDKRTIFADGFVQPRAVKVLDHGVLVGAPPDIWLLKDIDGDLRVDSKERIASGYGRQDLNVEVNANGLLWGMDNRIHLAGSAADMTLRFENGSFTTSPSVSRGQWGVTQDDAGRIYRNNNESVVHADLVPTAYYARHPGLLRTRGSHEALTAGTGDVNAVWPARPTPGTNRAYQLGILRPNGTLASYTAACAPTVFRGDRLPRETWGNLFVAEPTANVVSRIVLSDDGAVLQARKAYDTAEFLSSTDERFRPVYLSSAPDGTLYVVDMYRGIIQQGAYMTEYLRDQVNARKLVQPTGLGRIYRIVHEGVARDSTTMAGATPAQLLAALSHPNGWRRDTAQRLIVESGDRSFAKTLAPLATGAGDPRTRLHALWTLDGLNAIEPGMVVKALDDRSRDVRAAAIRIAERWDSGDVRAEVLERMDDPDWLVRAQFAASIGSLPPATREAVASTMLSRFGNDPIVVDATLSGLRGIEIAVLERMLGAPAPDTRGDNAIVMLAATVVREGDEARIQKTLLLAATARLAWQHSAVLRGVEVVVLNTPMPGLAPARAVLPQPSCPTCPGARGGPGGAYAFPETRGGFAPAARVPSRGPRLTRIPEGLEILARPGAPLAPRATALLERFEWPGKAGVTAAAPPLTRDEQQRFEAGQTIYASLCVGCHQPDGRGQERIAPGLVGSALVLAAPEIGARILLHGKEGPVGLMPPLGAALTDEQIAAALTYVRREWGHEGSAVAAAAVAAVRASTGGRSRPWTNAELADLIRAK
jgi:putative membrane-bound dehydrogenase-like protein